MLTQSAIELQKRGLLPPNKKKILCNLETKKCNFCGTVVGFSEEFCNNCKRPIDLKVIREKETEQSQLIQEMKNELERIKEQMSIL